jgi:2-methylcitrate dehydratase PrpD
MDLPARASRVKGGLKMDEKQKNRIYDGIASNILKARFEDIDQATVDNTKTRIFDTIGCAIGGATLPDIVALVKMAKEWGGKKEATIIGHGIKAPAHDVAFINCTMCRGFDRGPLAYIFKDRIVPHHVSETTVMTAFALGESKGVSGKELITALVVGDDIAARLHLANDHPLPGEYHPENKKAPARFPQAGIQSPTYGAAAIAGRLLGLTPLQMRNTLGLVGHSEGFGGGIWDGAPTFKIGQGTMARSGIMAAQLAKGGWTGAIDPFFNESGGPFAHKLDHPEMLTDMGKEFYVETLFKRYPGGGPTQSPNHAAIAIVSKYHIKAEDIEEAILRTSPGVATGLHYARPYKVGDYPTGDALFSYKYGVASALARGTAGNKDYTEEAVRDPVVQALIGRVTLALAELNKPEGVELVVKMKDGRTFSEYVAQAQGEPSRPLSRETLVAKFMEQVSFTQMVSKKNAEEILRLVDHLEEVDNIKEIVELAIKQ